MTTLYHIDESLKGLEVARELFAEYVDELDEDLEFQNLDDELEDPLNKYGPPTGSLVVGYIESEPAGCVALQALEEDGVCEMKRLFVRPQFREHGLGDELIQEIIKDAKCLGYKKMVLDTLERLKPALKLYEKHGFVPTAPYYDNPLANVVYMEKILDE